MESSTISLEELANDLGSESSGNEWTSEDEKKRLESAVQLILERASRKLGSGSFPTSITIKTSASGSSASFVAQEVSSKWFEQMLCSRNSSVGRAFKAWYFLVS